MFAPGTALWLRASPRPMSRSRWLACGRVHCGPSVWKLQGDGSLKHPVQGPGSSIPHPSKGLSFPRTSLHAPSSWPPQAWPVFSARELADHVPEVAGSAGQAAASLLSFPKQKAGLTPKCSECAVGDGRTAGPWEGPQQDLGSKVHSDCYCGSQSHWLRLLPSARPLCGPGAVALPL